MSKFNTEAAKKVVDAVREAMKVSKEIDPGYTRHAPKLPKIIKQTDGWEVDPKELRQFEKVIDLLVCSIFGLDSDGDRALKWVFIDRSKECTALPSFSVLHTEPEGKDMDADEQAAWGAVEAAEGNLAIFREAFERELRSYKHLRNVQAEVRTRKKRAKGCADCKETGFIRCTFEEQEKYIKQREFASRRHSLPTARIDCPKCQQPALKAYYEAYMKSLEDMMTRSNR